MKRLMLVLAAIAAVSGPSYAQAPEPVGVPACDEFLTKYEACLGQLPAAERPARQEQIVQMRANWSAIAAKPRGKEGLDAICRQTAGFVTPSLKPLGCSF